MGRFFGSLRLAVTVMGVKLCQRVVGVRDSQTWVRGGSSPKVGNPLPCACERSRIVGIVPHHVQGMSWRPPLFDTPTRKRLPPDVQWSLALLLGLAGRACAGGGALEVRGYGFGTRPWAVTSILTASPTSPGIHPWANQSLAQVEYDLIEFKKMRANSVRAEMVWNVVEIGPARGFMIGRSRTIWWPWRKARG